METNTTLLSIVIVSYNTKEITLKCLQSIFTHTKDISFEVIVVDNNSSDGSSEAIRREFPQVHFIQSSVNTGFAAGQNIGIQKTKGDYILVLNSDILFEENSCALMLKVFEQSTGKLGVIGPKILNSDGSHAISGRRSIASLFMLVLGVVNRHFYFKRYLPNEFLRRNFGWLLGRFHDNYRKEQVSCPVDYIDGMCALIKREALKDVGLFDERYFFDYEIIDLANRIRKAGWKIEYHAVTQLIHLGHASRKKTSRIVIETHKSELIYYATYAPRFLNLLTLSTVCVMLLKITLLKIQSFFGSDVKKETFQIYDEILRLNLNTKPLLTRAPSIPRL